MQRRQFIGQGLVLVGGTLAGLGQISPGSAAEVGPLGVVVEGSAEFGAKVHAALACIERERWGRFLQLHIKAVVEATPPIGRSWPEATGEVVREADGRGVVYWRPGYVQTLSAEMLAMLLVHEAEHVSQQNEQDRLGIAPKGAFAEFGGDRVAHAFGIQLGLPRRITRDVRRIQDDPVALQVASGSRRQSFLVWDGPLPPGETV
jgi:hypothetical protein